MGLNLSESALKIQTLSLLESESGIQSLENTKSVVDAERQAMLNKDSANKEFFDYYRNVILSYHSELRFCSGQIRTDYDVSNVDSSASRATGNLHFPISPPWTSFHPKLLDSNNGLPLSGTSDHEMTYANLVTPKMGQLVSGFSDGGSTTNLTASYSGGGFVQCPTAGFSIGQRIVVWAPGVSALCQIDSFVVAPNPGFNVTVIAAPSGSIPMGGTVQNYHPGFNNSERTGGYTDYPEVLAYFKSQLDPTLVPWKSNLNSQKSAQLSNPVYGDGIDDFNRAKSDVESALSVINSFQTASPTTKYSDSILSSIALKISNRKQQTAARAQAIKSYLGSVSQSGDGKFSGSGKYYEFFVWLDLRIGVAGSLYQYYAMGVATGSFDANISAFRNKSTDLGRNFIVKTFVNDADGKNIIKLNSVNGLSAGDLVKIMDESTLPIESAAIIGVNPESIVLNKPISGFKVELSARVVKQI